MAELINVIEMMQKCNEEWLKQIKLMQEQLKIQASKAPAPEWEIVSFVNQFNELVAGKYLTDPSGDDIKIHSVRRTSDMETFTVGEKTSEGVIDKFYIICEGGYMMAKTVGGASFNLPILRKVKQPVVLFTTEDGVKVYEGDKCYFVNTERFKIQHGYYKGLNPKIKTYSTREAAEEYILKHKSCLSIMDILSADYASKELSVSITHDKLFHMAKKKINP